MRTLAAFLFFAASAGGQGEQPRPTFRAGTALVRVNVQVVDRNGPVTDLQRDHLVVLDDGRPQPILHFGTGEDPLEILLLIDKSGSMSLIVAELAVSAMESLSVLRSGDRVGVMLFDSSSELLIAPTTGMEQVAAALESAVRAGSTGGGTDINGALFDAAAWLRRQPRTEARRCVLILTDNRSFKSRRNRSVIRELWEADAVLNALLFESTLQSVAIRIQKVSSPWSMLLTANVNPIVEETGGESLRAGAPMQSLRGMLDRIRKRYILHYRQPPGAPGKKHSVRVALSPESQNKHPEAVLRFRRGYISAEEVP